MKPVTEVVYREDQLQKEIIETLSNPYLFKSEEIPIVKCLRHYFPECKIGGALSEVAFNVFPLYELDKYNKYEFDKRIMKVLKERIPCLDIGESKSLDSFCYAPWVKDVTSDSDRLALVNYSLAMSLRTEFDVYASFKDISCALELKLNSDFVDKSLIYQPWRQLFQLFLLNLIYGKDEKRAYVYLVTMEDDERLLRRVNENYPGHLDEYIQKDNMKILSWKMIKKWLDDESGHNKELLAIRSRLDKYYMENYKATKTENPKDGTLLSMVRHLNLKERMTSAGYVIEHDGEGFIWYYKHEIDVSLPVLDNYMMQKWVSMLESAGFKATPKRIYWKYKYSGVVPIEIEKLLIEMLKELYQ
ncbi:MAG: hypothetical protein WC637_18485 [Victivallales bacterium]|jgi:hypothetical protein